MLRLFPLLTPSFKKKNKSVGGQKKLTANYNYYYYG